MHAEPAPEVVVDADGNYWRRYPDGTLSVPPTTTANTETVVVASYLPASAGAEGEREALRAMAANFRSGAQFQSSVDLISRFNGWADILDRLAAAPAPSKETSTDA